MITKESRRSAEMRLTTTQRTAEISAACYDRLPPLRSSATAAPIAATLAAFQRPTHTKPHLEYHEPTSLNPVSFLDREIYFSHLREGLINVSQTLAIIPNGAPKPWHRPTAQRRAPIAAKARSERRLSRSRARARLCLLSHHSAEPRRDWAVMRD